MYARKGSRVLTLVLSWRFGCSVWSFSFWVATLFPVVPTRVSLTSREPNGPRPGSYRGRGLQLLHRQ